MASETSGKAKLGTAVALIGGTIGSGIVIYALMGGDIPVPMMSEKTEKTPAVTQSEATNEETASTVSNASNDAAQTTSTQTEEPTQDTSSGDATEVEEQSAETEAPKVESEAGVASDETETSSGSTDPAVPKFDLVRIEADGSTVIAGRATPNAEVQILSNGEEIGTATASARGEFVALIDTEITSTAQSLALVADAPSTGRVTSQSNVIVLARSSSEIDNLEESPFQRIFPTAEQLALLTDATSVIVQPGNNLWTIAEGRYGEGVRYTTIFEANKEQIRDPDLIYPGQVFELPEGAGE